MDNREGGIHEWLEGYRRAWSSNDPDEIRALFTPDAEYRTDPWLEPIRGHDAIVEAWLSRRDEPGGWRFEAGPVAEADGLSFVQGETVYEGGPTYSNLWVIRLERAGRASSFTEWWMDQSRPS